MKESINDVSIEGVLSEVTVRDLTDKNDNPVKAGTFTFLVRQEVDGEELESYIPVDFYAAEMTKAGKKNPAYSSIMTILSDAKTLADGVPETEATKVRCNNAKLKENAFCSREGTLVNTVKISGSFYTKVKASDFKPAATFKVRMVVNSIGPEIKMIDKEPTETDALVVTGLLVQWNETVDEIKFLVRSPKYVAAIDKYWNPGDTVNASGFLRFFTETVEVKSEDEDGFGEAAPKVYTKNTKEYVITQGSAGPVEEGYDKDEVATASKQRRERMTEIEANGPASAKTTAPAKAKREW